MSNSDKEKKNTPVSNLLLEEVDEAASRENRPEITEKIQNRNAKV